MFSKKQISRQMFESLESRRMLSANVPVGVMPPTVSAPAFVSMDNGHLTVTGTNGNDKISVSVGDTRKGFVTTVKVNNVQFKFNGAPENGIYVDGLEGDDKINFVGHFGSTVFSNCYVNIFGGQGNDQLSVDSDRQVYVGGGDGDDFITADFDQLDNVGQYLSGDNGDDVIFGSPGDDNIYGGQGNDMMFGGQGNDYIGDWSGSNFLDGGQGNDVLSVDTESGSWNRLSGDQGDDTMYAFPGYMGGGGGTVIVSGGPGWDSFYHEETVSTVVLDKVENNVIFTWANQEGRG